MSPATRATLAVVAAAAIVTGALERAWVASHAVGTLTSDGAVIGLMALHLMHHGQFFAYMWGQAYGAGLEAALTAVVFSTFGVGVTQLLATTAFSSALASLALWRNGRRIVGDPAAALGALALWIWPASYVWRSMKPGGTYMLGLAVCWCAVGALARVRNGEDDTRRLLIAGFWCGAAFWASPMCTQLLLPLAIWCLPTLKRLGKRCFRIVVGGVVGGLPVLDYGVQHHFSNLGLPGTRDLIGGIPRRFVQFFHIEGPLWISLRVQRTFQWIGGPWGLVLALVAAAGFALLVWNVIRHRSSRCALPVITLLVLPVLFALNPLASHVGQARYVMFGASMGALLAGVALERSGPAAAAAWRYVRERSGRRDGQLATQPGTAARPRRQPMLWPIGLALLGLLGAVALAKGPPRYLVGFGTPDALLPYDDTALQRLVTEHHVRYAYANYWIAYRLSFELHERIDVAPAQSTIRYPPLAAKVAQSRAPAYLFVTTSVTTGRFERWCTSHGIAVRVWHGGQFTVVQPASRVLPSQLARDVLKAPAPPPGYSGTS